MELDYTNGLMENNIRVHLVMIRSMDMVSSYGLMENVMKATSKMVCNMDKEHTIIKMELLNWVFGRRESV